MLILEIDTLRLKKNLEYITKKLNGTELCGVIKADAYGHGMRIAQYMQSYCQSFAVNCGDEAIKLRSFSDNKAYILGGFDEESFVGNDNFVYTISSFSQISKAAACGVEKVAIKVNTGMNRLGFSVSEVAEAVNQIERRGIRLDSIYTHLFDPTTDNAIKQLRLFESLKFSGIKKHIAASNFLSLSEEFRFDAVRCGLAMYGYGFKGVEPIAKAYSKIADIHSVRRGDNIGYGEVRAEKSMKVATIAAGYADGINRMNTGKNIEINGCLCPIVGNICMDMCMADISEVEAREGDRVYFIGGRINAESLAENCNTIVYEILTSLGSRVRRKYI